MMQFTKASKAWEVLNCLGGFFWIDKKGIGPFQLSSIVPVPERRFTGQPYAGASVPQFIHPVFFKILPATAPGGNAGKQDIGRVFAAESGGQAFRTGVQQALIAVFRVPVINPFYTIMAEFLSPGGKEKFEQARIRSSFRSSAFEEYRTQTRKYSWNCCNGHRRERQKQGGHPHIPRRAYRS